MNAPRRPARPARRIVLTVAVLVAAATVVLGSSIKLSDGARRPPPVPAFAPPLPLATYRLTYAVTILGHYRGTETRSEQRPFLGRFESRDEHGTLTNGLVTNTSASYAFLTSPVPHWSVIEGGAHRAAGDQQAGWALFAALPRHAASVVTTATVLGRPCTVIETGAPLGSPITPPTRRDHAEECVESHGIVLRERWTSGGRLVRVREATEFDPHPVLASSIFTPSVSGDTTPPIAPVVAPGTPGSTTVLPVSPADLGALRLVVTPPSGYQLVGAQAETTFAPDGAGHATVVVLHFVNGSDLLDLEQGELAPPPDTAFDVTTASSISGRLTLDPTASSLDLYLPGGLTARLEGSDVGLLLAAGATVRERSP